MNRKSIKSDNWGYDPALDTTHEVIVFKVKHENPNSEQLSGDRAIVIWCFQSSCNAVNRQYTTRPLRDIKIAAREGGYLYQDKQLPNENAYLSLCLGVHIFV